MSTDEYIWDPKSKEKQWEKNKQLLMNAIKMPLFVCVCVHVCMVLYI